MGNFKNLVKSRDQLSWVYPAIKRGIEAKKILRLKQIIVWCPNEQCEKSEKNNPMGTKVTLPAVKCPEDGKSIVKEAISFGKYKWVFEKEAKWTCDSCDKQSDRKSWKENDVCVVCSNIAMRYKTCSTITCGC